MEQRQFGLWPRTNSSIARVSSKKIRGYLENIVDYFVSSSVRTAKEESIISFNSEYALSLALPLYLYLSIYQSIYLCVSSLRSSTMRNQPATGVSPLSETCLRFERYPTRVKLWILDSLVNAKHTGALLFESDKPLLGKRSFSSRRFISRLFPGYHFFRIHWFSCSSVFLLGLCISIPRPVLFLRDQFTRFPTVSCFVPRCFSICPVPFCWLTPRERMDERTPGDISTHVQNYRLSR